jgi:hypothetical protein
MWAEHGTVARDVPGTDLGDGHLLRLRDDGRLWCSYRRNKVPRDAGAAKTYAIEVAESSDGGATWRPHSVVATSHVDANSTGPSRGLWASFLLQRSDGTVQCYYDDERTPFDHDRPGHQWVTMKTWDPAAGTWASPVTVSRAPGDDLSRDGMPSVVELPGGRLLATVESVGVKRPHPNLVRSVTSDDGGQTWNWRDRGVVYRPARPGGFMALAPWTTQTRDGILLCVFCTDEDRDAADVSGTPPPRLSMDVKYVVSRDDGRTWSAARPVYDALHRNYLPGIIELSGPGEDEGTLLVQWINYALGGEMARRGRWLPIPSE